MRVQSFAEIFVEVRNEAAPQTQTFLPSIHFET